MPGPPSPLKSSLYQVFLDVLLVGLRLGQLLLFEEAVNGTLILNFNHMKWTFPPPLALPTPPSPGDVPD